MYSQENNLSYLDNLNNVQENDICPSSATRSKFVYRSNTMVKYMNPGGIWYVEILDDEHILFRTAQGAIDIRPSYKLNAILSAILIMNWFYTDILSYIVIFGLLSSILCIHGNNDTIHSWKSLLPSILEQLDYIYDLCDYLIDLYYIFEKECECEYNTYGFKKSMSKLFETVGSKAKEIEETDYEE